jgi:hypothetical protein
MNAIVLMVSLGGGSHKINHLDGFWCALAIVFGDVALRAICLAYDTYGATV